jgi:hypothetical protein
MRDITASIWNALGAAFTVALFIGGASLVQSGSAFLGLLLVGWCFVRASTYVQRAYQLTLGRAVLDAVAESRCNTTLTLHIRIDSILEHPTVAAAYERLEKLNRVLPGGSLRQWRDELLTTHRRRASLTDGEAPFASTTFEVRSGQLWKDGEYQALPVMFHEVLIPHDSLKRKIEWVWHSENEDRKYAGLRTRAVVINGLLKVQVGAWEEDVGHREPEQKYSWIAWDTITTFPLMLDPLDHYLPPRFLLLDYFSEPHHRKLWSRAKQTFLREADEYRRVLSTFGQYGETKLYERQAAHFAEWLKREGFTRTWGDEPPLTPSWSNQYLRIDIHARPVDHDTYEWFSDEDEKTY